MNVIQDGAILARAVSDEDDRLTAADDPLATLQVQCGGELPGTIAVPALLEAVRKARRYQLKLTRSISAQNGTEAITAWVEAEPREDGEPGCDIRLYDWKATPLPADDTVEVGENREAIDRHTAELACILDASQRILAVESSAQDLADIARDMREGAGSAWTDFVQVADSEHRQPMHWRLLDGARVVVPGSRREWRAHLIPRQARGAEPIGFDLLFVSDTPPPEALDGNGAELDRPQPGAPNVIERDIAPVLKQPIARIIANAETIRTRLAGPLADEYANYASEIANAGQLLLGLLDDLADLETVEADDFTTVPEGIDLAEVARQSAGILGVRASQRTISVEVSAREDSIPAVGEFRRVMQILLNLLGNAIRYSPENSQVRIDVESEGNRARATVADQGPGLTAEECEKIFTKFERLGRSGDGGTGLGLYISRRLARAMGGDLTVESTPGEGARFTLSLPRGEPEPR